MTRLVLVRHGQTEGFPGGDYVHLTERGVSQARSLGAWLGARGPRPGRVVVGPRERQQETWWHLADAAGWGQDHVRDVALDEIPGHEVFAHAAQRAAEGDVRWAEVLARVEDAETALRGFKEIVLAWAAGELVPSGLLTWAAFRVGVEEALVRHGQAPTMFVTSAGWIGAAVARAVGQADPVAAMELAMPVFNTSVSEITLRHDRWLLLGYNHTPHLGPDSAPTPI